MGKAKRWADGDPGVNEAKATWKRVIEQEERLRRMNDKLIHYWRQARILEQLRLMASEDSGSGAEVLLSGAIEIAEKRARATEVWYG